jgi:prepilin-type N-terminal cleavage/methylation domain-containing protein
MSTDRRSAAGGFTLLEIVVALALTGMLLLGARVLLGSVTDAAERLSATVAAADRAANSLRLLRDLAGRAEVRHPGGVPFRGPGRAARWESWCDFPAGWQERCVVALAVVSVGEESSVVLTVADGRLYRVRAGLRSARLVYLSSPADGGTWVAQWASELTPPFALGVVTEQDTLIVRVGERG